MVDGMSKKILSTFMTEYISDEIKAVLLGYDKSPSDLNQICETLLDVGVELTNINEIIKNPKLVKQFLQLKKDGASDSDAGLTIWSKLLYKEGLKSILFGVIWIIITFGFWLYVAGNPIENFKLVVGAQVTDGFIIDTYEDYIDTDEGRAQWFHNFLYEYQIPDGRKYSKGTKAFNGRLNEEFRELEQPYPIQVEYLPDNPDISRIKGTGTQSIMEWIWRDIGLGGLLLIIFGGVGVKLLLNGSRDLILMKKTQNTLNHL